MTRKFITTLLIASFLQTFADTLAIDTIKVQPLSEIDIHVRATGDWSLAWDATDDDNCLTATVKGFRTQPEDYTFGMASTVTISRITNGESHEIASQVIGHSDRQFSLRLSADTYGARLYCGDGEQFTATDVPFEGIEGSRIYAKSDKKFVPTAVRNSARYLDDAMHCRFSDTELLDSHLAASTDDIEGYWQYLDRNINKKCCEIGGSYRLAIVKCNPSDLPAYIKNDSNRAVYQIVYLSGATLHPHLWNALDVKGWLVATSFVSEYDLYWLDSTRRPTAMMPGGNTTENSSSLTNNALLTLRFPLLKSEIRFSRQHPASAR